MKHKNIIDDGYYSFLVNGAVFEGQYQIQFIKEQKIEIPKALIPFEKRRQTKNKHQALHFYQHDTTFRQILTATDRYIEELALFDCVISPDFSLYFDMPLVLQITNTYFNRAVGYYLQSKGIKVIPNIRWSTKKSFPFCFDGVPEKHIYSISTHGCIKSNESKYHFRQGLEQMLIRLRPKTVLVHGWMPDTIFKDYLKETEFHNYYSLIAVNRGRK